MKINDFHWQKTLPGAAQYTDASPWVKRGFLYWKYHNLREPWLQSSGRMNRDLLGFVFMAAAIVWTGRRLYLAIVKRTIFISKDLPFARSSKEYPVSVDAYPFYYHAQLIFFTLTLTFSIGMMAWFLWGFFDA